MYQYVELRELKLPCVMRTIIKNQFCANLNHKTIKV
ncbi:Uncharacterised protein [Legionella pneumophila]|nr:Uncharacterised protein [Legionella pneumophila]